VFASLLVAGSPAQCTLHLLSVQCSMLRWLYMRACLGMRELQRPLQQRLQMVQECNQQLVITSGACSTESVLAVGNSNNTASAG
jgi:hypothetical protein